MKQSAHALAATAVNNFANVYEQTGISVKVLSGREARQYWKDIATLRIQNLKISRQKMQFAKLAANSVRKSRAQNVKFGNSGRRWNVPIVVGANRRCSGLRTNLSASHAMEMAIASRDAAMGLKISPVLKNLVAKLQDARCFIKQT